MARAFWLWRVALRTVAAFLLLLALDLNSTWLQKKAKAKKTHTHVRCHPFCRDGETQPPQAVMSKALSCGWGMGPYQRVGICLKHVEDSTNRSA